MTSAFLMIIFSLFQAHVLSRHMKHSSELHYTSNHRKHALDKNDEYFSITSNPTALYEHRTRIVGGRYANIHHFPFTACLILKSPCGDDFRGGAVIIADKWAVTAAHCMAYINQTEINRRAAFVRSNTDAWITNYIDHVILEKFVHEKYDPGRTDFDVAVLRVGVPFRSNYEVPIKLAPMDYQYKDNTEAIVLGWGTTEASALEPFVVRRLRYVIIKLINLGICQRRFREIQEEVTDRMLCAGSPGKDACVFDSGGPLYQNGFLIGLVSWGSPRCADKFLPGVYTRLSKFYDWIQEKINSSSSSLRRTH